MGSSSSKFRKHLQNGDEYAAMHLFTSSSDLHKGLDPNSSYGDSHSHNTPMHYVARHAMKSLLRYSISLTLENWRFYFEYILQQLEFVSRFLHSWHSHVFAGVLWSMFFCDQPFSFRTILRVPVNAIWDLSVISMHVVGGLVALFLLWLFYRKLGRHFC